MSFIKTAYPSVNRIVEEAPVVADYLYKVVSNVVAGGAADPEGQTATSLYRILHTAAAALSQTETGSIVLSWLLDTYNIDIVGVAIANDLGQVVDVFRQAAPVGAQHDVAGAVSDLVLQLVAETVTPYGRLGPLGLASDLAVIAYRVVDELAAQANALREAAQPYYLADGVYYTLWRLKEDLSDLRDTVGTLSDRLWSLKERTRGSSPPPAYGPDTAVNITDPITDPTNNTINNTITPASPEYGPGAPPSGAPPSPAGPSTSPDWWLVVPSPAHGSPSPDAPSDQPAWVSALWSAADSLGATPLMDFAVVAAPQMRRIAEALPTAADYSRRVVSAGATSAFTDDHSPANRALYAVLSTIFQKVANTTTGGIIADRLMDHSISLAALASADSLGGIVSELRRSTTWSFWEDFEWDAGNRDGFQIVSTVTSTVQYLVYESVSPLGRLTPVTLAREALDIAETLVDALAQNAAVLRQSLDAQYHMSDEEYTAFYTLQDSLLQLQDAFHDLY